MVNLLRMDLYRLIRSKSLYVCLGLICFFCVMGIATIWFASTPEFSALFDDAASSNGPVEVVSASEAPEGSPSSATEETSSEAATTGAVPLEQYLGSLFVTGGGFILLVSFVFALFIAAELESGFIKNVFSTRKGRGGYFVSKMIIGAILSTIFFIIPSLVSVVGAFLAGFEITVAPLEFILWSILVVLVCTTYVTVILFFVMLTRSKTAGIIAAFLVSIGVVGIILSGILGLFPNFAFLIDFTVYGCLQHLNRGLGGPESLSALHIAAVTIAYLAAFAALGFASIRKRDI